VALFVGEADPRSQAGSSYNISGPGASAGKFANAISSAAPNQKGRGKWSTSYGYQPNVAALQGQVGGASRAANGADGKGAAEWAVGETAQVDHEEAGSKVTVLKGVAGGSEVAEDAEVTGCSASEEQGKSLASKPKLPRLSDIFRAEVNGESPSPQPMNTHSRRSPGPRGPGLGSSGPRGPGLGSRPGQRSGAGGQLEVAGKFEVAGVVAGAASPTRRHHTQPWSSYRMNSAAERQHL
jgi:hypothetical protein